MATGPGAWFDARRRIQLVALLLAVAAAVFLILAPMGSGVSSTVSSDGTTTTTETTPTLVETNGRGVLVVLLAPVVLTAVALLWTGRGRAAAAVTGTVLLASLCIVGLMSIGLFYLPAAIAAGVALGFPARRAPTPVAPLRPA